MGEIIIKPDGQIIEISSKQTKEPTVSKPPVKQTPNKPKDK